MQNARDCLDEIVSLYQNGPEERASELLQRIADLYFLTLDQQSAEEKESFGDVMIRMSDSADLSARALFAERLSRSSQVPTDLLRHLAQDQIIVARPILQYSESLREGDLVAIIRNAEQAHLSATALRNELTVPVTDILVQRGSDEVHLALAQNVGANISPKSMEKLFELAGKDSLLLERLNARRDSSRSPIHKLKRLGDAEFWQNVAETLLMSEDELDSVTPSPQAAAEAEEVEEKPEETETKAPPASKDLFGHSKAVNEKLLVDAARAGNVLESVELLANITHLEKPMVEHCLFQAHIQALMVLCKANKLSPSTFTSLLQLRENMTQAEVSDTIALLRRYEAMSPETAKRVIKFADKSRAEKSAEADE